MKCEEFELSVRELARHQLFGELMEAGLRAQATAHALDCTACTVRLADARSLSEGLRSLAVSTETSQAPDHLEAALLAAFRQPVASNVVPLAAARAHKPWPHWALAAAAALLLALVSYAVRATLNRPSQSTNPQTLAGNAQTPLPMHSLAKDGQITATPLPSTMAHVDASSAKKTEAQKPIFASAKRNKVARYRIERYLVESEIATDFLPLTENADVTRNANMQTIRVEVPRMMMSRFGLPVSFERAAEPVKADLLIGPDGQTRAIRFVQTEFEQPQIISANTSRDQ
jgi:hypothetical protein